MNSKPEKQILELTNKFLEDFFELSAKFDVTKKPSRERNESFYFNYGLADAIAFSDYATNKRTRHKDFPIIYEGATYPGDRLALLLFSQNIKGVFEDLKYVLTNFGEQIHDDCEFKLLKVAKSKNTFWCHTPNVKIFCTFSDGNKLELRMTPRSEVVHRVIMDSDFDAQAMSFDEKSESVEVFYWSKHREVNEFYSCLSVVLDEIKCDLECDEN